MAEHRDPNDDRPQHYGHYAGAILITGVFAVGAIAAVVAFLIFLFSHWWAILIVLVAALFLIAVFSDVETVGSIPVAIVNTPTNSDMIQGRLF